MENILLGVLIGAILVLLYANATGLYAPRPPRKTIIQEIEYPYAYTVPYGYRNEPWRFGSYGSGGYSGGIFTTGGPRWGQGTRGDFGGHHGYHSTSGGSRGGNGPTGGH
jgi:hypothetical protein